MLASLIYGISQEKIAADRLRDLGLIVDEIGGYAHGADLIARNADGALASIEVKASRPRNIRKHLDGSTAGGFQFLLYKADRSAEIAEDFIVLLCDDPQRAPVWYVIPRDDVKHLNCITLMGDPETYSGKFARYRDRFDLITNFLDTME